MLRVLLIIFFVSPWIHAEDDLGLENKSELGYVVTGGNAEAESSSLKQTSVYKWSGGSITYKGHYLSASGQVPDSNNPDPQATKNEITAENWSSALRYDKVITPKWFNIFASYGWRGDRFQGVEYGQDLDFGGKYHTANSKEFKQFFELGYRYTREFFATNAANTNCSGVNETVGTGVCFYPEFHYLRVYGQIDYEYSKSFSMGAWIEYLPSVVNFSKDQRINFSPYITSVLTDMFSLKVAYESRYRHERAPGTRANTDFTFTTSLLASF
jgi:putative salt-induced outer membrane protein YdiY